MKKVKLSTRNWDIVVTCVLTALLTVFIYFITEATHLSDGNRTMEQLMKSLNGVAAVNVIIDSLTASVIIWCVIGLIDEIKGRKKRAVIIKPVVCMVVFITYLLWYVLYNVIEKSCVTTIVSVCWFIATFVVLSLYFADVRKTDDGCVVG